MIREANVRELSGTYGYVFDMFNDGLSLRGVIEGFDIHSVGSYWLLDLVKLEYGN